MSEEKKYLDFRGLQLYHQKLIKKLPKISVDEDEEKMIIKAEEDAERRSEHGE